MPQAWRSVCWGCEGLDGSRLQLLFTHRLWLMGSDERNGVTDLFWELSKKPKRVENKLEPATAFCALNQLPSAPSPCRGKD